MSKIKILYTIPNFKTAGSQYVVISIFRKLDKSIFDPYICVENYPDLIPSFIPQNRRLRFSFSGYKAGDVIRFGKLLRQYHIDIVHSWDYKSNYLEALASRLFRIKYLYTKKNNSWSKRWRLKSFFANHIAYDNPDMEDRFFASNLLRNKINFVPHGVDITVFKPLGKIPTSTFNLGCIGNIGRNKNQLFLIKALISLPEEVVLHLYGKEDESYRKMLDRFIETHSLGQRVCFHGFIANSDLPKVMRSIDVFVLVSFHEGMPVSILEALACGLPVLSSDSGGGARYLLGSEKIFSLERTEDLVDKILDIYNLERDSSKGEIKEKVENININYSLDKEVATYEKLYKSILG